MKSSDVPWWLLLLADSQRLLCGMLKSWGKSWVIDSWEGHKRMV